MLTQQFFLLSNLSVNLADKTGTKNPVLCFFLGLYHIGDRVRKAHFRFLTI